jgi:HK97 family phage portal protein
MDWIGPTSLTRRRGPEAPIAATRAEPLAERKAAPPGLLDGYNAAFTVRTLVHGPGAGDYGGTSAYGSAGNSAVFSCLQAIASAVAEPDLAVYRVGPGERVELEDTDLGRLLARPNPHMSMDTMLGYLSTCLHVEGNAYWRKLRAGDAETGPVVELWPVSPRRISPHTIAGSGDFVSYYRYYYSTTQYLDVLPEDVVHFTYGLDDADHRLGMSPLRRLVREISSDDQATRYADRLLANLAINGLSLEFDKDAPPITQAIAEELKARIGAAYGGDNVGSTAVLSPGAKLTALGFSPEQLDMKTLHRVPEERISAVLGVPAIVAGLGAGLDHATYSNVEQAREAFTETKLIPLWRSIAATLTTQLLPGFYGDASTVIEFDTDDVRALATDQDALALRLKTLVEAGIMDENEARAEIGLPPRAATAVPVALPAAASRRLPGPGDASRRSGAGRALLDLIPVPTVRAEWLPLREKAIEDLPRLYGDLRDEVLAEWVAELTSFLASQRRRALRLVRDGADTASEIIPEVEVARLGRVLAPLQTAQLAAVLDLCVAELGVAFDLDDPATREYLRRSGAHIVGITETTRSAVQTELTEGQMNGEGIPQLAARIRSLPSFGSARATVIARTELAHSTSTASLASYMASGVVTGVTVLDGDFDAACAAMNGRTFTLDQAPPTLEHPQCTRAFSPIVRDASESGLGTSQAAG